MPAARIQRPHGVGGVVLGRRTEAEGSVAAPVKALLAFFDATDEWDDSPLHEELVRQLERQGIAGATVLNGFMVFNFATQQLDYLGVMVSRVPPANCTKATLGRDWAWLISQWAAPW
jgi:hypothetical protein